MAINRGAITARATIAAAILAIAVGAYFFATSGNGPKSELGSATNTNAQGAPDRGASTGVGDPPSLNLTDSQLASVKVEPVGEHEFRSRRSPSAASTSMRT
jgi:hypothetical protein